MTHKSTLWVAFGSVAGVLLGALVGYLFPEFLISIDFIGRLFVNALTIIIVPLIVTSIIVGISNLGNISKVGRILGTTVLYFAVTSGIAVLIGMALVGLFGPGSGVSAQGWVLPPVIENFQSTDISTFATSLIPSSVPGAVINGNYLGIILLTVLFAYALMAIKSKGKKVIAIIQELNEVVFKLVDLILIAVPVGIFVLVGSAVAANSDGFTELGKSLAAFTGLLILGLLIHGVVILPAALRLFSKTSPTSLFRNLVPALTTAFGAQSSAAALSVTYNCVIDKSQIDRRAGALVLPLGAAINVNATAMYAVMGTGFVAQMFSVDLSIMQWLAIGFTGVIASVGISGVPFAALFLCTILFSTAGFPAEAYAGLGLLFVADWFYDRLRATVNVWSDAVGAAVVAETFEFKTARHSRVPARRTRRTAADKTGREGKRTSEDRPRRPEQRGRRRRDERPADARGQRPRRHNGTDKRESTQQDRRRSASPSTRTERSPFAFSTSTKSTPVNLETAQPESAPPSSGKNGPPPSRPPRDKKPAAPEKASTAGKDTDKPAASDRRKTAPRSNRAVNGKNLDQIDRELSKISAQLEGLDNKEEPSDGADTPNQEAKSKQEASQTTTSKPKSADDSTTEETVEKSPAEDSRKSVPESTQPPDEPADSETVSYGRRKQHKGAPPKEKSETEKVNVPDEVQESYSVENQSFGRTKKKVR